jgi:hypothetical protein
MIDRIGMKRPNDTHVICASGCKLRPDLGDHLPTLPPRLKWMLRRKAIELLTLKLSDLLSLRNRLRHCLTMHLSQLGLVIKRLQVGHSTGHVQPNDPLGFRRMVQWLQDPARSRLRIGIGSKYRRVPEGLRKHRSECHRPDPHTFSLKKSSAVNPILNSIHGLLFLSLSKRILDQREKNLIYSQAASTPKLCASMLCLSMLCLSILYLSIPCDRFMQIKHNPRDAGPSR